MKCTMRYVIYGQHGDVEREYKQDCPKEAKYWVFFKGGGTPWGIALLKEALCPEHALKAQSFSDYYSKEPIESKLKVMT